MPASLVGRKRRPWSATRTGQRRDRSSRAIDEPVAAVVARPAEDRHRPPVEPPLDLR